MKKLRDVPLRYRAAASLLYGGMSLFLFGVVFALVRQADRAAANQAWAWMVIAALIALIAAAGAFCALIAWGTLSDPKLQLGAWVQKRPMAAGVAFLVLDMSAIGPRRDLSVMQKFLFDPLPSKLIVVFQRPQNQFVIA